MLSPNIAYTVPLSQIKLDLGDNCILNTIDTLRRLHDPDDCSPLSFGPRIFQWHKCWGKIIVLFLYGFPEL